MRERLYNEHGTEDIFIGIASWDDIWYHIDVSLCGEVADRTIVGFEDRGIIFEIIEEAK